MIRLERECSAVMLLSACRILPFRADLAQLEFGVRILWILGQRGTKLVFRTRGIAAGQQRLSEFVMDPSQPRVSIERLAILRDGLLAAALVNEVLGHQLMHAAAVWCGHAQSVACVVGEVAVDAPR